MILSSTSNTITVTLFEGFAIDNESGIKDPKGMTAHSLATRAVMVMTPKKNILSVVTLLENAGLEVVDVSLSGIGDMASIKDKRIKDGVGAVINIGHETTSISLFNKGIIVKHNIIYSHFINYFNVFKAK